MKSWSRILLISALAMSSSAGVKADPWQINTCYISCGGASYIVTANSLGECCAGTYSCPDNSSPSATVWSGGPGEYPTFCGPFAD
jgi:hypothetical protein